MDAETAAREYYRTIDAGEYDALAALLSPGFVHHRPDREIEGRETFVRFMHEERPDADTTHAVEAVYAESAGDARDTDVAVRGRLLRADGEAWFGFVDVFAVEDGRFVGLRTYTA
jgi:ketosteroid isomerase-like protein